MAYVVCDVDRPLSDMFYSRNGLVQTVAQFRYYFPKVSKALLFKDLADKGKPYDFQFVTLLDDKDITSFFKHYEWLKSDGCGPRPEDKK